MSRVARHVKFRKRNFDAKGVMGIKKWDKENIMVLDYERAIGEEVFKHTALYNQRKLTEDEVMDIIRAGEQHPALILVDREQYENVFIIDYEEEDDDDEDEE